MYDETKQPTKGWGLLAMGRSGNWQIDLDEALDGPELSIQIEDSRTHLAFRPDSLLVIPAMRQFLQSHLDAELAGESVGWSEASELRLGQFGTAPVSLRWDNEGGRRCFLVIAHAGAALFITLQEEDIRSLCEALSQVIEELPENAEE